MVTQRSQNYLTRVSKQPSYKTGSLKENFTFIKFNENILYKNMWDAAKATLREKFIALKAHISKEEKSQINNLNSYLNTRKK